MKDFIILKSIDNTDVALRPKNIIDFYEDMSGTIKMQTAGGVYNISAKAHSVSSIVKEIETFKPSASWWIATDMDGKIYIYKSKPYRGNDDAWESVDGFAVYITQRESLSIAGRQVTWEDEPIEITVSYK